MQCFKHEQAQTQEESGAGRVKQIYSYYGVPHQRKCNTQVIYSGFGLGGQREKEKEKEDSQLDEISGVMARASELL